jgi:hypothetical protein
MKHLFAPLSLALLLTACQQETPPTQPPLPKTDGGALPERAQAGIDTLNKAKEAEGVVRQQAAEQEKAINSQTQ